MHHLVHRCCMITTATRMAIAGTWWHLRMHHHVRVESLVVVCEQMVEHTRMRIRRHLTHASPILVSRVDIRYIRAQFRQRCWPLGIWLFILRAVIAKHIGEFSPLVWNSTLKTVTGPHLEFFVLTVETLVWNRHLNHRIVGHRLEPRDVEWSRTLLHLRRLHNVFLI
jgi:hypothetical protein